MDYEGRVVDLVQAFIEEEYKAFPVGSHDDMLDTLARIREEDLKTTWPMGEASMDRYARRRPDRYYKSSYDPFEYTQDEIPGVESGCGAVAVGWACLFPPLSSGGALVAQP